MAELSTQDLTGLRDDIVELKVAIREMSKALERLARLEEKHVSVREDIDRAFSDLRSMQNHITALEMAMSARKPTNALIDKIIYAALGALGLFAMKKLGIM